MSCVYEEQPITYSAYSLLFVIPLTSWVSSVLTLMMMLLYLTVWWSVYLFILITALNPRCSLELKVSAINCPIFDYAITLLCICRLLLMCLLAAGLRYWLILYRCVLYSVKYRFSFGFFFKRVKKKHTLVSAAQQPKPLNLSDRIWIWFPLSKMVLLTLGLFCSVVLSGSNTFVVSDCFDNF